MKILVTGGAGFIGSAFIRHSIYHTQDQIVNLDKLTYAGNLEALHEVANDPRYAFELVDICDMQAVQCILKEYQPDCVVHFAAESHVDRSIYGAAAFIQTNIVGTYTLLEAVRDYYQQLPGEKKKTFRFLHISTDEVYGDVAGRWICLRKPQLMRRAALIQRQRLHQIIWFVLGTALMDCR